MIGVVTPEWIVAKWHCGGWRWNGQEFTTLAKRLLCVVWTGQLTYRPSPFRPIHTRNLLTGKPSAGKSPVRFGGKGEPQSADLPIPIEEDDLRTRFPVDHVN